MPQALASPVASARTRPALSPPTHTSSSSSSAGEGAEEEERPARTALRTETKLLGGVLVAALVQTHDATGTGTGVGNLVAPMTWITYAVALAVAVGVVAAATEAFDVTLR